MFIKLLRAIFFIFLTLAFIPTLVFSQSIFLYQGTSGLGLSAGMAGDKNSTIVLGIAGFSLGGIADFSGGYGALIANPDKNIESGTAGTANFSFLPVKQDTLHTALTLAVSLGYSWAEYTSKAPGSSDYKEASDGAFTIGAELCKSVPLSTVTFLATAVQFSHTTGSNKNSLGGGVSLSFGAKLSESVLFVVTSQGAYSEQGGGYGVSIATIIPLDFKTEMTNW